MPKLVICDGFDKSLAKALGRCGGDQPAKAAQLKNMLKKLESHDLKDLPSEYSVPEGDIKRGWKFFCLKRKPKLRVYYWVSKSKENTIFLSHCVYKDQQKLSSSDVNTVKRNWRKYE